MQVQTDMKEMAAQVAPQPGCGPDLNDFSVCCNSTIKDKGYY